MEELREKIANITIVFSRPGEGLVEIKRLGEEIANQVLDLIKEAGYLLPSEDEREEYLHDWATANGYRKLCKDQSVPKNPHKLGGDRHLIYGQAQDTMLTPKDGTVWAKVELEVKE